MTPPGGDGPLPNADTAPPASARWRAAAGMILFVLALICPVFIPLVAVAPLPVGWKTVISGGLAVGIPELLTLAAIALLGKAGFELIKRRVFGWMKRLAPAARVSRTRYRIGLVLFVAPILFGSAAAYAPQAIPGYGAHRIAFNLAGDILFLTSLFILGGDFWNKVRSLFLYDARAQLPPPRD